MHLHKDTLKEKNAIRYFRIAGNIIFSQVILLLACIGSGPVSAEDFSIPANNSLDVMPSSKGMASGSFVAVPIPISNPTIGSGLQAALLFLHKKKASSEDIPNATSGLVGIYTDKATWGAGLFHDNYLLNDHLRIRAGIGTGEVNLEYYAGSQYDILKNRSFGYSVKGDIGLLQLQGRIPGTESWYAGTRATYLGSEVTFDFTELIEFIPEFSVEADLITLTLGLTFDNRNDNYYPSSGRFFDIWFGRNDSRWGSDAEFNRTTLNYSQYVPVSSNHIIAVSLNASEVDGDTPFFLKPSLNMRGFVTTKYQDEAAASAHIEWRYKFATRWGSMVSYEAGSVGSGLGNLDTLIHSVGAGIRWKIQKDNNLNLGVDVGVSKDDSAFYIVIGEKF